MATHRKFTIEALEKRVLMTVFMVTDTNPSGAGSLFAAITAADSSSAPGNSIQFNIPGSGGHTIVAAPLPAITEPVLIDGLTQPGAAGKPVIEVIGGAVPSDGLDINAIGVTVRGLALGGFADTGIAILAPGATVTDCYIGVDLSGNVALPNGDAGLYDPETTGGDVISNNVVSGNGEFGIDVNHSPNDTLTGNFVGTNAAGSAAIPNGTGYSGIYLLNSPSATIDGNVVSGSLGSGIELYGGSSGAIITANMIGTDVTGTYAIANIGVGIYTECANTQIGSAGAGNVISGNDKFGIYIGGSATTGTNVQANLIGTNAAGTAAIANNGGIWLTTAVTGGPAGTPTGVLIGGSSAGDGNIVSGNTGNNGIVVAGNGNTIQNNRVGTNAAGTAPLSNYVGIFIAGGANNVITGNLASGNSNVGIGINGATAIANVVQGNLVGTDVTGTMAIGNATDGIFLGDTDPAYPGAPVNTLVGGTTAGAGNVISGNDQNGIAVVGSGDTSNVIEGNFIGTDVTGKSAIGNLLDGIFVGDGAGFNAPVPGVAANLTIGGTAAGAGNVIADNLGNGIDLTGVGDTGDIVTGNFVGTDLTGTLSLGNDLNGILIDSGAASNTVGPGNTVAFNYLNGILVDSTAGTSNIVTANNLYSNGAGLKPGSIDRSFNSGTALNLDFAAQSSDVTSSGSILLAGLESGSTGGTQAVLEQLNSDGSIDSTFGATGFVTDAATGDEAFYGVVTESSGVIVAVGASNGDLLLAAYNADGSVDTSFGTDGRVVLPVAGTSNATAFGVTTDASGNIIVAGSAGGQFLIDRFSSAGAQDTTFNGGAPLLFGSASDNDVLGKVAVQSNGAIVAAGASAGDVLVARFTSAGALDSSFGVDGTVTLSQLTAPDLAPGIPNYNEGLAIDSEGRILLSATSSSGGLAAARLTPAGALDSTFGSGGIASAALGGAGSGEFIAAQPDDSQILVAGIVTTSEAVQVVVVAFTPAGALDPTFGNNGSQVLSSTSIVAPSISPAFFTRLIRPDAEGSGAILQKVFGNLTNGKALIGQSRQGGGQVQRVLAPPPTSTPLPIGTLGATISAHVPSSVIGDTRTNNVISVTVDNSGQQAVSGHVKVLLYASLGQSLGGAMQLLSSTEMLRLKPNAHTVVRLRLSSFPSLPQGSYYLIAAVDAPDGTTTAVAGPLVEVAPPAVSIAPSQVIPQSAEVKAGGVALMSLALQNTGNVPALGVVVITIAATADASGAGGVTIATVRMPVHLKPATAGHYRLRIKVPPSLVAGMYYLAVSADGTAMRYNVVTSSVAVSTAFLTVM